MINPEDAGPTLNIRSAFVSPSFELFHYFYPFYPKLNVVYTRLPGVRVTAIHVIMQTKTPNLCVFFSTLYVVSDFVIASEAYFKTLAVPIFDNSNKSHFNCHHQHHHHHYCRHHNPCK